MNQETMLYMITETSRFMMGFVIITRENHAIVVDGGRPEDMPLLKQTIGGRHISAWILTHAHTDHISGLVEELDRNGGTDFDIEKIYYHFPDYAGGLEHLQKHDVACEEFYKQEIEEMLPAFMKVEPLIRDISHVTHQGESIQIDECRIDFLFSWHPELTTNLMNDSSLVFKLYGPRKTVLFLGDLGPEGGDYLYRESRHLLKADMVQMAHHGHMNVGMEVYAAILPEACLWCAPDWLYEQEEIPSYLEDTEYCKKMGRIRMFGTAVTRQWMDLLGVKTHYVTKDGTQKVEI